ncbi:YigZ family protein [Nocardioides flavus (ex Wang et al. 2016)]|uniref:YigZ family protein n=1 Tax=Nocardioides flavus (ex Wang et al. 2016) TaxID=2058780 RepID=A0ABQ3HN38_9ACTN|nr:YigZ family protein [Nocardioides flavus (ex Wang et al. 2016)]GHE18151.1 YigZ family protein [Nocardioides flavus (ex Wang et al. 2016)]
MTSYLTVARDGSGEVEDRGSRFVCTLRRVGTEEAARELVAAVRREHWDARHHCSAFVLGPDGSLQRSSDDGEPAGTAGAPMLEVLKGAGVSDVAAVVSRWFGGTLLGAGGLVRAYGDAVRAALAGAGTLRRSLLTELALDLGHADAGRVEGELRARGARVLDVAYDARVRLLLAAAAEEVDRLSEVVAAATAGHGVLEPVGERWVDVR